MRESGQRPKVTARFLRAVAVAVCFLRHNATTATRLRRIRGKGKAGVLFGLALILVMAVTPSGAMAASRLGQHQVIRMAPKSSLQPGEGKGADWCSKYGGTTGGSKYSVDDVYACGPASAGAGDPFEGAFQCTELSGRFLWAQYGLYVTGICCGADVVDQTHSQYPNIAAISNGTVGSAPNAGTVMSFSTVSDFSDTGHTAVIQSSTVDGSGNGSIEILGQNVNSTYDLSKDSVVKWVVQPIFGYTHIKWLGLSTVGSGTGPPAAAAVGNQQTVFWKGANNHLFESWYVTKPPWNGPLDITQAYLGGAAPLASSPSVAVAPNSSQQSVFWRGPSNHLFEAWYTASTGKWNGPADITAAYLGNAAPLTSAPSVAVSPDNSQLAVFWQGPSNHLFEAWYVTSTGKWNGPADITAAIGGGVTLASSPSVAISPDNSQQTVFWQGPSNHLFEAWYVTSTGKWNGPADITAVIGGRATLASAPSVAISPDNSQQTVFWQDPSNHLFEAWYVTSTGTWNGPADITATSLGGAALLSSSPSAAILPGNTQQIVFWRGATGHIYEAWYVTSTGAWHGPADMGWM